MCSIATEWEELYKCRPPEGLLVPILVTPAAVEDGILGEEEVAQAVRGLNRVRAGVPLGMRLEDLKGWLREVSREADPVTHRWQLLVRLIQKTFEDGAALDKVAWVTMVFIPKGRGEYRGIGLVEVVWKVCVTVVNFRLKKSVMLHDALHRFRSGRGRGAENLEAKLAQQLAGIAHEPLFQISLDVRKAYDSLDRGWYMEILRGYRME